MSYSDRNSNSGSIAAALGAAVAIDDIENVGNDTNSNNQTTTVNKTETETETRIEDSYNSKDVDVSNTATTNVGVDIDVTKTESKVEDSYNSKDVDVIVTKTDSSVRNETETKIEDSYNTKNETKIEDSYNTKDIDVAVSKTEIEDSYNTNNVDASIDVALTDAFKKIEDSYNSDDDWLELDNLDFDVMNVVGAGTLAGNGNDGMFNLSQVSEMMDKDVLIRPEVKNDAWFEQDAHAHGGDAYGADELGDRSTATTTANGAATLEAFTQNIVMGSNIQYNNVDLSVVGGDSTVNDSGDIG